MKLLLDLLTVNNVLAGATVGIVLWILYLGRFIRYIPNNRVGVVEKLFSLKGSVTNGIIALGGEAGYQPRVLRGGWHVMKPFIYRIHKLPLVTIPQGSIGYVFARDGSPLAADQALASNIVARDFEDVESFLLNNGQKGPQRKVLREGTYAINLAQFVVITRDQLYFHDLDVGDAALFEQMQSVIAEREGFEPVVIKDKDDGLGVVTVHDGPSLSAGEIIAPLVGTDPHLRETFHNNFQDPEAFLRAGGLKGRQYQVLVEGTYYINRLFATVEIIAKTVVEVGQVGVVVSYTGQTGTDLSGDGYKHGELVTQGSRGVWETPLLPGKYAFNTYAGKIVLVPTTNFILKWKKSETGSHRFDENLSEVMLITKDAFEPSLPLSVVVHIAYTKAPLVIQRFGDIKRLVEQTLDPMVSAYFKNVGQTRTLIQLLQERSEIQRVASMEMKEKFAHYNLELEEVLIGTPAAGADSHIEQILVQLRSRQIAEEQVETYSRQQRAAGQERELREAEARAKQQQLLTESEIDIQISSNEGKAEYQRALQEAAQIRTLAEAEAEKAARIGIAQAMATEEQVRAYGGAQYQVLQQVLNRFSEAVERSHVDVVPKVVISSQSEKDGRSPNGSSSIIEALMAMVLSEKVGVPMTAQPASPQAEEMRRSIREKLTAETAS
ncbi:MAG: SPFH domain-containing protein [Bdellovibrionota bacterium]